MTDERLKELRLAARLWRYYPTIRDGLKELLYDAATEIERLWAIEGAVRPLVDALDREDADWRGGDIYNALEDLRALLALGQGQAGERGGSGGDDEREVRR